MALPRCRLPYFVVQCALALMAMSLAQPVCRAAHACEVPNGPMAPTVVPIRILTKFQTAIAPLLPSAPRIDVLNQYCKVGEGGPAAPRRVRGARPRYTCTPRATNGGATNGSAEIVQRPGACGSTDKQAGRHEETRATKRRARRPSIRLCDGRSARYASDHTAAMRRARSTPPRAVSSACLRKHRNAWPST